MDARTRDAAALQDLSGRTLGGYRVLRAIAAGGMATLYLARKTGVMGFAQTAALKVVHAHLAVQQSFVAMFLDEARIASCINHPNVCRVLDFGEDAGTYFLAMEYVRGESFADVLARLREKPLGREHMEALTSWIMQQACEGLHAAHEATGPEGQPLGIVHRDVSPQNLLIGYDGSVRIVDFGIAYAAERSQNTRDGAVRGRYGYMSPEQMRGAAVDRRADVWSLGVMLREALEGKRLFARDTDASTIYAVTEQPLPGWQDQVPSAMRTISERAMARDVEQRYPTARALGQELARATFGRAFGSAELAQLMEELFAERIASNAAMLRELLNSRSEPEARERTPIAKQEPEHGSGVSAVRDLSIARKLRSKRSWLWVVGVSGVALAAAGLLLSLLQEPTVRTAHIPATRAPSKASAAESVAPQPPSPPISAQPNGTDAVVTPLVKPTPPAKPRKTQHGTVVIGARNGWATLSLNGKSLGSTPIRTKLPTGVHTLTVKPQGREPSQRVRIEVRAGETTKLLLTL